MRYAVTGTSRFAPANAVGTEHRAATMNAIALLARTLLALEDVTEFTTGAAPSGIDVEAFFFGYSMYPNAHHRICVPVDCDHCELVVKAAREKHFEIIEIPGASPAGYMKRNDALVAHADIMLAFPRTPHEAKRGSGTWATIRRARKAQVPVRLYPLSA
jgi:hypothetical protein